MLMLIIKHKGWPKPFRLGRTSRGHQMSISVMLVTEQKQPEPCRLG